MYEKAYLENKKDKILLNNLIGAYIEKREIEKSKSYLDQAKKLDSNYNIFKYHEAKYLFLINKVDEAINLLKEINNSEENIEFIGLLCRIYFMTSRLNDGNKFLTEKLSKYPNNPKLLRFKCFRSLIDGNFDEGWSCYKFR